MKFQMTVKGIIEKDENHKIVMVLKEVDSMTDGEYKTAVEEEFKKLAEPEKKT